MKTVTVDENGEIPLIEFKDMLDITKVVFYSIETKDDKIVLNFYDENEQLIELKKE